MGVVIVEGEGTNLWVNLERPIVTNGAFATRLITWLAFIVDLDLYFAVDIFLYLFVIFYERFCQFYF